MGWLSCVCVSPHPLQLGIFEAFKVKNAALLSATEAAEMILRVGAARLLTAAVDRGCWHIRQGCTWGQGVKAGVGPERLQRFFLLCELL